MTELINPVITKEEGIQYEIEGCLSIPGEYYETIRPEKITVEYDDRYGEHHVEEVDGFRAVCYCHEIDHTNGILFLDRLNPEPHDREELEERARIRRAEKNNERG